MNRHHAFLPVCLGAAILTGCSSAGEERALMVSVRDAQTHEAIRNAVVRVEPQRPVHPFDVKAMLFGADAPDPESGFTDASGKVSLKAFAGLPMTIVVGAAGRGVETFFFEDHPAKIRPGVWMRGRGDQADVDSAEAPANKAEGLEVMFAGE